MSRSAPPGAGVAVVVPVRDDDRLALCLAALARSTLPAAQREVVVVDDGSRRPLDRLVARFPGVRLLRQAPTGSYAARNRGVAATTAPVVAFTDADCLPEPDWLEQGLAALQTPGVDVVAGCVEVFPRGPRPRAVELFDAVTAFPQEHFVRTWGFGATANLFTRRATLLAVGPFDRRLRSGGDADWGQRATAAGFRTSYEPHVRVRHPARATLAELAEKSTRTARGVEDLGVLRSEVTPLPEALRRHLAAPAGRLREARAARLRRRDLPGFTAVAALAGALGAAEVLRGRVGRLRRPLAPR